MNQRGSPSRTRRARRRVAVALLPVAATASLAIHAADCPPSWAPAFPVDPGTYPFAHRCLDLGHGLLHYLDESPADPAAGTALLLHGNPTWSYLQRDLALALLDRGFRVVAPDYYGFGLSDKPPAASFGYSPADHADVVEQLILALDLRDLALILQDWGGSIGVTVAGRHPERVSAFVILNTLLQRLDPLDPGVTHWAVDFGLDNIAREDFWVATGKLPRDTGVRLGLLHGPEGSPAFLAVRNAYWGPFLDLDTGLPLTGEVVVPSNTFAQNLILSGDYLDAADQAIRDELNQRPAFLLYGADDPFFGALRCDPVRIPACPAGSACEAVDGMDLCLLPDGRRQYPYLDGLRDRWRPESLFGVMAAEGAGHFVQEHIPLAVAAAAETVAEVARRRLVAGPLLPGAAGQANQVTVEGAEPGATIWFLFGLAGGQTPVPGCGGLVLGLADPRIVDSVTADGTGLATLVRSIPAAAAGREVLLQAVEGPGAACRLSNIVRAVLD